MADTPVPTAREFISKWDYENASQDQAAALEEQARDFPRGAQWEPEDLMAAFSHLRTVACTHDFPVYDTGPAAMANAAIDWLLKQTGHDQTYYDEYLAFIVAAIAAGPKLFQIEMMRKIVTRGMRQCLKTISGDRLKTFLRGLKKQFENNETMPKEYCSKLSSVLRTHVLQEFSKEQMQEYLGPFLEVFMFYQSLVPGADEHYGQLYYTHLVSALEHLMGRDKWKGLEDALPDPTPLMIGEQIRAITNLVKSGKFPAYEKQPDLLKSCLRNLLQITRENKSYFPLYLDDVVKSLCVFGKLDCDAEAQGKLLDPYYTFFNRLSNDCKKLVENKPDLFEKYAPMVTNLLLDMKHPAALATIIKNVIEYFLTPTSAGNPNHVKLWIKLLAAMVSQPDTRYIEAVERFMKNQKKLLKWKDNADGAQLILTNIGATKYLPKWEGSGRRDEIDPERVGRAMGSLAEELLKQVKFAKSLGVLQPDIIALVKQILDEGNPDKFCIAKECCEFIELKDDLTLAVPAIEAYERQFQNEDYPWSHWALVGVSMDLLIKVIQAHKDPVTFKPYISYYVSIFKTAMGRDYLDYDSGSKNIFGYVLTGPLIVLGALYRSAKDLDDMKPLLADTVRLLTCDDEDIANAMSNLFLIISMGNPELFAPYIGEILQALLDNGNTSLFRVIEGAYNCNPDPVDAEFDKIFDLLNTMEANSKGQVISLLKLMALHSPTLYTTEKVDHLLDEYMSDPLLNAMVLQLLEALSKGASHLLEPHVDTLYKQMTTQMAAAMVPLIVVNIGMKNKKFTGRVFDGLIQFVTTCTEDYTFLSSSLNSIRVMGSDDRELLKPHKALFEAIGNKHAQLKEMCKALVDIIEGRSVEDITQKMDQQQEGLEQLDTRVTNTEKEVTELGQEVGRQGAAVGQLQVDVTAQGSRLNELGEVVDDTVLKVEEIDNKTLSSAPVWSRDVSKLLNPEAEHDWRLLAQRLGYFPEDIRGWATQHDPCMSMLSEWFATHKTSEATKAVLKTLEEMNRLDAAEIVGRAMKAAESVVADEPPEYENPPPVFLSYQWGHQPEVRLLRKHLEMAGFESWMDIGQMGGGDKLYAKIDEGIRAAKAVICCVTDKYAKSPNCNREVNLAVNLGKPIIPILLEKVTWPPPGSMGPIFGEYLYIRFFHRDSGESTGDERIWPAVSFQELLMQLSYLKLLPELSKIKPPYTKWWEPPEEVIVIKKKSRNSKEATSASKSEEQQSEALQPEVFISYQWGIQPQVKALYKRLCGLGYHCWMDIHQMGGGDSLYDKIDRGVRGCRVVLSCVTEKYSKSANCRREVSLADALKKPIIPLLLEDTTWPPSGPMSMVFTQLLYVDFKDEKARESWSGAQFEELLGKIKSFCPDEDENALAQISENQATKKPQPEKPVPTPENGEQEPKVVQSPGDVSSAPPIDKRPQSSQSRKTRPFTPKRDSRSKSCLIL